MLLLQRVESALGEADVTQSQQSSNQLFRGIPALLKRKTVTYQKTRIKFKKLISQSSNNLNCWCFIPTVPIWFPALWKSLSGVAANITHYGASVTNGSKCTGNIYVKLSVKLVALSGVVANELAFCPKDRAFKLVRGKGLLRAIKISTTTFLRG